MFEVLRGCNVIGYGIFGSMASNSEPPQPSNYDNIEMEGIGSLTLPNSLKAPFEKFELSGNSAQGENPSIESPKEIKNSGKYDETSGKYVIDVSVTGKNLINVDEMRNENGYLQSNYVKSTKIKPFYVEKDKKYLLIAKGKSVSNEYSTIYFGGDDLKYTHTNTYVISTRIGEYIFDKNKYVKIILTANKTAMITSVIIHGSRLSDDEYEVEKLGLFEMSQSDSIDSIVYEPYHQPQTLQLQLDEPLRGIGEYKDVVTKDGVLRKIKEIVLDENTGFETYWATLNKTFAFISPTIKDATVINFTPNRLLCNYFKALPDSFDRTDEEVCTLFNRRFHVRFLKERNIDTVEKLKEWLKQNPIKIQYLLQEPVTEQFENSLENLHANNGTTVISVDSGEVETGIKLTYRKEK